MSFSPQSKVWVYQSDRQFTPEEAAVIQNKLDTFTASWRAHGNLLTAKAEIRHRFFIVLLVDEHNYPATGCSIDASVRVLKQIENEFGLNLFDRFNMAYRVDDTIVVSTKEDFETLVSINKITADTIVFNNMVQNLQELQTKWEVPFKESWHKHIFGHLLQEQ